MFDGASKLRLMRDASRGLEAVRLGVHELRVRLLHALRTRTAGIDVGDDPSVEPLENWGGFVSASFRVIGGGADVVVKLAHEPQAIEGLRRWERFASLLEARHHAPHLRGPMRLEGTAYEGAVFDWVEGGVPRRRDAALVARVAAALDRLHGDADLAARLAPFDPPRRCRDVYFGILDDRFRADLRFVGERPPPFVGAADLEWMRAEVDALARLVEGSPAFAEPADAPCHGDLWTGNLVVGPRGTLGILDWDGLALGDPVFDVANLLGPTEERPSAAAIEDVPSRTWSEARRVRFSAYARAGLFDAIVDGLADWADAETLGEGAADMRARKRASVEAARREYRTAFGGR